MNCLSPSILACDLSDLKNTLIAMDDAGAQYVHIDVMDGIFVPNITFGMPVIKAMRPVTDRIFDVHLMIDAPERYIHDFADAGADIITVHAESTRHLDRTIEAIRERDVLAGVALNPATPLSAIEYILPKVDMVLIMSVNPGFGGQKFITYALDKIEALRQMLDARGISADIEVDGGITLANADEVLDAGANIIVAGSAVFKGDMQANIKAFLDKM